MTDPKVIAGKLRDRRRPLSDEVLDAAADLLDPPPEGPWEPKWGDEIWVVGSNGFPHRLRWDGDSLCRDCLDQGNVRRTLKEAARVAARRRAKTKLRRAKGVTVRTEVSPAPRVLLTTTYEADTYQNACAAWNDPTLTDEERDALLGGE